MFKPLLARDPLVSLRRSLVVLLTSAGLAVPVAPAVPAWSSHAHLDRQVVSALSRGERLPVIVVARGDLNTLKADLRRTGIKQPASVPIGHGFATNLTPALIQYLSHDPNVERIVYDAPVKLIDTPYDPSMLATAYPVVVDAVAAWSNGFHNAMGRGIGVAVIDSGLSAHPDLQNRISVNMNFNPNVSGTQDANGHGTAVAGIIAGDGTASAGRYIGIAPRANVISLRVNDGSGAAPTSAIMNAILWAVQNKDTYNIRVMNLSLLTTVKESYRTSPIDAAVEYAWLNGIVVVVAAGNSGPNSTLYAPANDPYVITVGASDDHGTVAIADDTLATFSSYGVTQDGFNKPDFVAPGRRIIATLAPGSSYALNHPTFVVGSQYIRLSGTSVAAPVVAGVAALVVASRPALRPGQLKAVLFATSNRLPFVGSGAGYPDAARAITYNGRLGNTDRGLEPNNYLKVLYMEANHLTVLPIVSWESVSWDRVSWDSVSWDRVSWDAVSWSN
jgi:serine protease AprX